MAKQACRFESYLRHQLVAEWRNGKRRALNAYRLAAFRLESICHLTTLVLLVVATSSSGARPLPYAGSNPALPAIYGAGRLAEGRG